MTGYTTLTDHAYVVAYQAELRDDLRNAGTPRGKQTFVNRLADRWLTRTGTLRATRSLAPAGQSR